METALIRMSSLTAYPELVRELGADPEPFLQRVHASEAMINDPKQMLPYVSLIDLIESSAEELECPDFGLRLSGKQSVNILGPLAIIGRNEVNAYSALTKIGRYMGYYSPAIRLQIDNPASGQSANLGFNLEIASRPDRRQIMELSLGVAFQTMKMLIRPDFHPQRVVFSHPRGLPMRQYRNYFGCPVEFNADRDALIISSDDMLQPIDGADSGIRTMMENFVSEAIAANSLSFSDVVKDLIIKLLPVQRCTISMVSKYLAVSERTLQRRLKNEDMVFENLVDDVRKDLAWDYLTGQKMRMSQLTALLGYTEQSSFNRACQRWFQRSPLKVRAEATADADHKVTG